MSDNDPQTLEPVFDKMRDALDLMRRHDTRAFNELVNSTRGIFVFGTILGGAAEYWRDETLIVLQSEYTSGATATPQALAVILVHEATHVWLERRGFEYAARRRTRLEGICNRRALRLAKRLPDADYLANWLRQGLLEEHLTDEAFQKQAVAELVRLGVPSWLLRHLQVWSRRWQRLTRAIAPPLNRHVVRWRSKASDDASNSDDGSCERPRRSRSPRSERSR